jgi:diguanylate cyclase (GGDEF)-like protein
VVKLQEPLVLLSRDGKEYAIQDAAAPIHGRHEELVGAVLTFSDITEVRCLAREMSHQARHDALTGLINRREFERRLQRVLTDAKTHAHEHALCYLDLDQFKLVNDTCGHGAGDELLRQISTLMQGEVRKRDTLARLGGDEFGVLLEHCSLDQAMRVAGALRKVIEDFYFLWETRRFNIGVSIGVVAITAAGENLAQVLSAADSACYLAKEAGRNRIHLYRLDDKGLARRRGEMQWIARIHQALAENRFRLDFQPIDPIDGSENAGVHYELLLRMEDAELGLVLPSMFLPAAERYGLAIRIDRWVISTAFAWLNRHPRHLQGLYLCAINLSALSLGDEEFLQFVIQQFELTNIPPTKVCFEITETAAIANFTNALHFMQILKERGCRFALDDFGSGLSSFTYLKNFPVDFLKIDGAFVKDIINDPVDLAIVKSINEVGHVVGKQTIAEFVENAAILDKLRKIGVDYAQGHGIGRPQSLAVMTLEK